MSWATIAADLTDRCFAPLGNAVTIAGVSGKGILKSPSESFYDGVVVLTDWTLELPASVWPSIEEGAAITVDGVTYLAREQGRIGADQSTVLVPLELAPAGAGPAGTGLTTLAGTYLVTAGGDYLITQ